jgi:hypothetical protein
MCSVVFQSLTKEADMLRRRLLIMLAVVLLLVLTLAGYKGLTVYHQIQQFSAFKAPVSVGVATVEQRQWQGRQTVVPQSAIAYTLAGDSVYVVIDKSDSNDQPMHIVERRPIDTGETRDGLVVITDGLTPGDRVVTAGQAELSNGTVVSITPDKTLQFAPRMAE